MPIAKNIKYCRQKEGLTQQSFADKIGVSKATVVSWESKKTAVPVPSAKMIANYFGVSFNEFCDIDIERLDKKLEHGRITLTDDEVKSILMFRQLPGNVQKLIRYAIITSYENNVARTVSDTADDGW